MAFERLRALLPGSGVPIVPVMRLAGPIGVRTSPFQQSLSLAGLAGPIRRLFSVKRAPAVAIVINSPGGSPVQSNLIFKRIRQLADEKQKKVFVFVEDVAASGGYFIAVAGDEIIADFDGALPENFYRLKHSALVPAESQPAATARSISPRR